MVFRSTRLVLPKINFMATEQEKNSTWRDDLTALINKLQEENKLLRKVQESFQSAADSEGVTSRVKPGEEKTRPDSDEDLSELNENINQ
jgi:hypothetical protein